ncbi:MAG: zinc-binding dehydrogenase [Sphaerobacter sp.]|nr:zinc-binding dehydrogenase [Sphaerobacter sp.]
MTARSLSTSPSRKGFGVASIPTGLDTAAAGALGLAGTAALQSIEAVAPTASDTVLISGATGGVGALAVQLAVARGARVIATVRLGEEADFVRDLGAAHTVDYTGDIAAQVRAISPQGVDAVIHPAGDGRALADLLAPGGRFASPVGLGPDQLGRQDVQATSVMATPTPEVLAHLAEEVVAGRLHVPIWRNYRLEEVAQALADFAAPHVGKLAVSIG